MCKILLIAIGVNLCISSPILPGKIFSVTLTHGLKNHYKYKNKMEKNDWLQCRVGEGWAESQNNLTFECI